MTKSVLNDTKRLLRLVEMARQELNDYRVPFVAGLPKAVGVDQQRQKMDPGCELLAAPFDDVQRLMHHDTAGTALDQIELAAMEIKDCIRVLREIRTGKS